MKYVRPAIALTVFFVVGFGLLFPAVIYGLSQAIFPHQANGSLIKDSKGNIIGSEILGQNFAKPEYFHPRPSAAGSGYDAANSSGTNLGPNSDKLINGIHNPKNPSGDFEASKTSPRNIAKKTTSLPIPSSPPTPSPDPQAVSIPTSLPRTPPSRRPAWLKPEAFRSKR